jgi:hypothetical protein
VRHTSRTARLNEHINIDCVKDTLSAVMNDARPLESPPQIIILVTSLSSDGLSDDDSDHEPLTT